MGRTKKSKESNSSNINAGNELPDDYTVASGFSGSTFYNASEDDEDAILKEANENGTDGINEKLSDAVKDLIEVPMEKNRKVRDLTFRKAYKALSCYAISEEGRDLISARMTELVESCTWVLTNSKASATEQYAACRCLEVISILLGPNRDEYCEDIDADLTKVVRATGKDPPVRGVALRALAISAFVCGTDESKTIALMNLCLDICNVDGIWRGQVVPVHLRSSALEAWALLATTIDDTDLASNESENTLSIILPILRTNLMLSSGCAELRTAAGECVALIHESRLNLGNYDDKYSRGSWDGSQWEDFMDELKVRVEELSVESGHHMSKKAKKEQRATFRDIAATVTEDEPPSHVVSFRGGDITLGSWREIVQLNYMRHCLQGGFQIQLMTNPALHLIFEADGSALSDAIAMSQIEKRLFMSKTSDAAKAKDKFMTKRRTSRNNQKNLFLTADGEEI